MKMERIGRNDPCPCGSGKKYKKCHFGKPMPAGMAEGVYKKPVKDFEDLLSTFCAYPVINVLGALQIRPSNHGYNDVFECLARKAHVKRKEISKPPYALYPETVRVIREGAAKFLSEPPTDCFTECAVFSGGNYVVYPGISHNSTEMLNQLLECIFFGQNDYPEEFKKQVHNAANLLLFMSDLIASYKKHPRYLYQEMAEELEVPDRDELIEDILALEFTEEQVDRLCLVYKLDKEVLQEFVLAAGDPALTEKDPDRNIVLSKPIYKHDNKFVVYMPTTIVESLLRFIKNKSAVHDCWEKLLKGWNLHQFELATIALWDMDWFQTNIQLPDLPDSAPITETVFQFDNQKYGYLCYINPAGDQSFNIQERKDAIVRYLENLNKEQPFRVFSLLVIGETGDTYYGIMSRASGDHLSLTLRLGELMAISFTGNTDSLSLWKFAKALNRYAGTTTLVNMESVLDAYAIYEKNDGSLMHSDRTNPANGLVVITPHDGNEYIRQAQINRDEHAVPMLYQGNVVTAKVFRYRKYVPIYKLKEIHKDHRLVIETYPMPIWITNYQAKDPGKLPWAHDICEGVAFWLHRMEPDLRSHLASLSVKLFEIEIIVAQELIEAASFEIKDTDLDKISLAVEVSMPVIKIHIPYEFLYLVRQPDNRADKLLMKAALEGIGQLQQARKDAVSLTIVICNDLVEKNLQVAHAKMFLFSDASANVRMDTRGLPSLRYIPETDISHILDNLFQWLPKGYQVKQNIEDIQEKTQLCDHVVDGLYKQLKLKLPAFNGERLIQWLISMNEKAIQVRESYYILVPAKIACFSSVEEQVEFMGEKEENLATAAQSLRTLIEYVACDVPVGARWPNEDDIDELLAICNQISSWGALGEAIHFKICNPAMGLLASGRIGSDKTWQKEQLASYSSARIDSDVFQYVEKFEKKYFQEIRNQSSAHKYDITAADKAYQDEFGIELSSLSKIAIALIREGFELGKPWIVFSETELVAVVQIPFPELTGEIISNGIFLMMLLPRPAFGEAPQGYKKEDIFSWRYTRQLSYLRRPLVPVSNNGETVYYFGFRHMDMYLDYLYYILFNGKLPNPQSPVMRSWLAGILHKKGKPYRDEVKDWLKKNTSLKVIDYEVKMKPRKTIDAEKDMGDIDVLAIDQENFILYSLECKNGIGARNIHEMKLELDQYLGREGKEEDAKIAAHVKRHEWLKKNPEKLIKIVTDPHQYKIVSAVITSDEFSLNHLAKDRLPLPVISFATLRRYGIKAIPQ